MSVAELDEVGRRRENPRLVPGEPALTVDELREEVPRVSDAMRAEFEREGLSKRFARLLQEREHYRRDLEQLAPDDPVLERENREDLADLERSYGSQARSFASRIAAPARTAQDWARIAQTPAAGASRRRLLARVSGKLLASVGGVDPALTLALAHALNHHRCAPPLAPHEVTAVVRWAMAREVEKLEGAA